MHVNCAIVAELGKLPPPKKMVFLGLCPKPLMPHPLNQLPTHPQRSVFKAKNTDLGKLRTPGSPPFRIESKKYHYFTPSPNKIV